jgi:hypothetical protein
MEAFAGIAILTTNLKQNIDDAFLRRLRFIVDFPLPDAAEREAIWRRAFPDRARWPTTSTSASSGDASSSPAASSSRSRCTPPSRPRSAPGPAARWTAQGAVGGPGRRQGARVV